jgi:hypothetical protein
MRRPRSGQWSTTLSHPLDRKQRPPMPEMARLAALLTPAARERSRFPSHGGSWLGGSDELRESRFRRCSSSSTRPANAASCLSAPHPIIRRPTAGPCRLNAYGFSFRSTCRASFVR